MAKRKQLTILLAALLLILAACAKKKKSDDFQNFGGVAYNAAPKTIINSLGLNIAVQAIDINYDGKMDGLYICRTGGIKQDIIAPTAALTGGTGYTNSPTVTITGTSCTTQPAAVAVVANGRVERLAITNPGAGCTSISDPTITGGSGTGASAHTTGVSGGKLTRVTMVSKGSGYNAPMVDISGGGGSGATAGVNVGHGATGALTSSGVVTGIYLLNPGDGRYTTSPTVTVAEGANTSAVVNLDLPTVNGFITVSELDASGNCSVTYDPTNANPDLRHIPQMLFTWPVTPTTGLDTNGDTNADYYLYNNGDGTAQVMTNSDGSGAAAKLLVKNPAIEETLDQLYKNLAYGQIIGFDILNNNTISNNILGKIALDREDVTYIDKSNPVPIISPIRNDEFYAAPMDVNILCADKVACNAIAYSLVSYSQYAIQPPDPNFGNTNLDLTGVDFTGTKHAIKPGDSATISFQNLPYGNYYLKYAVRDAAGNVSASLPTDFDCTLGTPKNCIRFTIGRKPDIIVNGVNNRYVSNTAGTSATIQWTADTASPSKRFRYLVVANSSCIGYSRGNYITPPGTVIASGGPLTSGTIVNTAVAANAFGMDFTTALNGNNIISICAISCSGACAAIGDLEVMGEAYESIIRDDNAPTLTPAPLSGIFPTPQRIWLTGSTTTGGSPINGSLIPSEICYTWGADAAGNPLAGNNPTTITGPGFTCPVANNVVRVTSSEAYFNVGCPTRASVTDMNADLNNCSPVPGIYYIKYIAKDAAGNVTGVGTQAYAIAITPQIFTDAAPAKHLWTTANNWGNTATAVASPRTSTTWQWHTDFPGTFEIRINSTDCTDGTVSSGSSTPASPAAALNVITSTINGSDLTIGLNDVKVCLTPSGGGSIVMASQSIWRIQPKDINATYAKVNYNKGETITIDIANDLFEPINAIKTLAFSCPAASYGPDSNVNCPASSIRGIGAPNAQGIYSQYELDYRSMAGTTSAGSPNVTGLASTTDLAVNMLVSGAGIPAGTTIASIVSGSQITLTNNATSGGTPTLTFKSNITTLAFDLSITLCDTTGCAAAAVPPTWTTGANGGSATMKAFVLKDKTAGNSIFVDAASCNDAWTGVNRTNSPAGTGPKCSLSSSVAAAAAGSKAVYVMTRTNGYCANGAPPAGGFATLWTGQTGPNCSTVTGQLTIPTGVSVYGGFTSAWYRPNVDSNQAVITAGSTASATNVGVSIGAVNTPVWIEGLDIRTRAAVPTVGQGYNSMSIRASAGGSSELTLFKNKTVTEGETTVGTGGADPGGTYGVHLYNINTVTLRNNTFVVRNGFKGLSGGLGGANGSPGLNGNNGNPGGSGCTACSNDSTTNPGGGAGGTGGVAGLNDGGNGGSGGEQNSGGPGSNGSPGGNGSNGVGGGGGGNGGRNGSCGANTGSNGNPGPTGSNGSNGASPGNDYGQISGSFVKAYQGSTGTDGTHGSGGGGGGGGGGEDAFLNDSGSGGGGGGGGGAAGTGGEGGWGGGPSIPVYLENISTIHMIANTLTRGAGG
ncbi:MAG: hypothetical protein J0L53_05885, partial [Spirochaetes bacterium]|nr:hypothetical protein [Spirochaetota bacterium]